MLATKISRYYKLVRLFCLLCSLLLSLTHQLSAEKSKADPSQKASSALPPIGVFLCTKNNRMGYGFLDKCYILYNVDLLSWRDARQACKRNLGNLAKVHSSRINGFLFKYWMANNFTQMGVKRIEWFDNFKRREPLTDLELSRPYFYKREIWIGGFRDSKETQFEWVWTGSGNFKGNELLNYTSWGSGYRGQSNCMTIKGAYSNENEPVMNSLGAFWYDARCNIKLPYICEFNTNMKHVEDDIYYATKNFKSAAPINPIPSLLSMLIIRLLIVAY